MTQGRVGNNRPGGADPFHREQFPLLVVISGPSGVGKDSVVQRMREQGDKGAVGSVDWALDWIDQSPADAHRPFFLFMNWLEPHLPYVAPA
ncbi:MAG: hypothetical protein ACK2UC_12875, partial [Anaerolineae bacterium]